MLCVYAVSCSNVIISFSIIANTTQGTIEQNSIDYYKNIITTRVGRRRYHYNNCKKMYFCDQINDNNYLLCTRKIRVSGWDNYILKRLRSIHSLFVINTIL